MVTAQDSMCVQGVCRCVGIVGQHQARGVVLSTQRSQNMQVMQLCQLHYPAVCAIAPAYNNSLKSLPSMPHCPTWSYMELAAAVFVQDSLPGHQV